jgi:hypothetical protein
MRRRTAGGLLNYLSVAATTSLWFVVMLVISSGAQAADDSARKSFEIVRIAETEAPQIDGKLDDPAWQSAAVVKDLRQFTPTNDIAPSERSEFYVMYDKDAIYVGARLWDSEPDKFTANILRQGQQLNEDRISVILDTFNDKRNGYRFEVNRNSIRDDALFLDTTQVQRDWDGIYFAHAIRNATGWTAEMAIPFKTLSFDPAISTWGINFQRTIALKNERIGWVFRNRAQNPSSSGQMTGLVKLDQGVGLDIIPGISFRRKQDFASGKSEFGTEPSLDAYYKLTAALNAAITINTDFSATEADERQVNLSRFSLFFPEKRSFFLRDSDVFEFGGLKSGEIAGIINPTFSRSSLENGKPFFSRSIGLSSAGQPVDIVAGAKVAGRVGKVNLAAMAIRQDQTATTHASTLLVGRVVTNVLSESSLGVTVTSGNPRSNLRNTLIGADFRYLNTQLSGNRSLEGELWLQKSATEGISGDDTAYGIRLRSPNNTGWRGGLGIKELQNNFNPALGYVNRKGVRDLAGELGFTRRFRDGFVQSLYSGLDFEQFNRIDGGLQSMLANFRVADFTTRRGDNARLRFYVNKESLNTPFNISAGVTLPVRAYSFNEYEIDIDPATSRQTSIGLTYRAGNFYSGRHEKTTVSVALKPSPHFWFTGSYAYDDVRLPEGRFVTRLISTRFDLMFNATWSWVTLVQYDNVSRTAALQSRVHWIPQAGREMFLVYGHNLIEDNGGSRFRSQLTDAALKLNYTFRF